MWNAPESCVPFLVGEVRAVSWPTRSDGLEGRKAMLRVSAASVPLTFVFFYSFQRWKSGASNHCLLILTSSSFSAAKGFWGGSSTQSAVRCGCLTAPQLIVLPLERLWEKAVEVKLEVRVL